MNAPAKFPDAQRANLVALLRAALNRQVEEEGVSFDRSFVHVALDILGYDASSGTISDGAHDYGVDFWVVGERSSTIFQFKSQDFTAAPLDDKLLFGPAQVADLGRLNALLQHLDDPPREANAEVAKFVKELRAAIHRYSLSDDSRSQPYQITVFYCALARGLTTQAYDEYRKFATEKTLEWAGQKVSVETKSVFIDYHLAEGWREENTDWRDAEGRKSDTITLHVRGQMIEGPKSLVFFTSAEDLVFAFDAFGYQIFEPNVRCELKRSRVNEAIKESINTNRGRKEFKHLNNGITLICASFRKINKGTEFEVQVRQPGVINGLQTVKSIHDAYDLLNGSERAHFRDSCDVLVRLHTRDAVHDYKELVKSTNNQNPMQPRNLSSNNPEQIHFEKQFAAINWFYERKEGAWKAFQSDAQLWGSLRGKRPSDFKSSVTGKVRSVDNLEMAQAWLSFIGYSNEAIHNKREIFPNERFYDLVFKKRVTKHGYDYNLSFSEPALRAEALELAPNAEALLLAQLLREVADELTPSRKENREGAIARLRIQSLKKEDQDAKLVQDAGYIRGLVLAGAKYLFVEFAGLILFKALGPSVYEKAPIILRLRSMAPMFDERDIGPMRSVVDGDDYKENDLIPTLWAIYNSCLENLVEQTSWRQQFEQAAVRSRFNYSDYNRRMLYAALLNLDKVYQKRPYPTPWSAGIEKARGIFSYGASVVDSTASAPVRRRSV